MVGSIITWVPVLPPSLGPWREEVDLLVPVREAVHLLLSDICVMGNVPVLQPSALCPPGSSQSPRAKILKLS